MFLGEDRVGYVTIACGVAEVGNDHPPRFLINQEMLESLCYVLSSDGVDRSVFERYAVLFDPHPCHQLDVVGFADPKHTIDELEMVFCEWMACRMASDITSEIRPLNFFEKHVERVLLVLEKFGVELAFEADEFISNAADTLGVHKQARDYQHRLLVVDVAADLLGIARFVDVADVHTEPQK